MLNEKREKGPSKDGKQINDLLMKPFSLGWTREVVRRVITKNGTPNCDIYYFSPSGKKIRSLTEAKGNLTDGLSPECFSFKREPLGLAPNFETVRDARIRRKADEKSVEKGKSLRGAKKPNKNENSEEEVGDGTKENKKKKTETEQGDSSKSTEETVQVEEKLDVKTTSKEKVQEKKDVEKEAEGKQRKVKSDKNSSEERKSYSRRKKTKTKVEKLTKRRSSIRSQPIKRRKEVLKKIRSAKQAKVMHGKKILKKMVRRKVASAPKRKLTRTKSEKETKRKSKLISKGSSKKLVKTKPDIAKEVESTEAEKKSAPTDLKSIVKNNIGKYREMREKQKLGIIKTPLRNTSRKIVVGGVSRTRSEPISKNKIFYLKPLENGWRRELVFRTNCARAGQQADVYYFHPNGKKLRSCREIAENLTHGLSIECFTFRKEPIGCGEPSEVIRNARSNHKN